MVSAEYLLSYLPKLSSVFCGGQSEAPHEVPSLSSEMPLRHFSEIHKIKLYRPPSKTWTAKQQPFMHMLCTQKRGFWSSYAVQYIVIYRYYCQQAFHSQHRIALPTRPFPALKPSASASIPWLRVKSCTAFQKPPRWQETVSICFVAPLLTSTCTPERPNARS